MKKISLFAVLALCAALLASSALAAGFPAKPIQLLIPFGAGGSADLLGRAIAKAAEKELGQPVVAVNRPGGGGAIMYNALNNAKSDGYTVGWASTGLLTVTNIGNVPFMYDQFANLVRVGYSAMPIARAQGRTLPDLERPGCITPKRTRARSRSATRGQRLRHPPDRSLRPPPPPASRSYTFPWGPSAACPASWAARCRPSVFPCRRSRPMPSRARLPFWPSPPPNATPCSRPPPHFKELGYDVEMDLFRSIAVKKDVPAEIQNKLADAFAKAAIRCNLPGYFRQKIV